MEDGAEVNWTQRSARVDLPAAPTSGALARDVLRQLCAAADLSQDTCDTALLLTTELVTNAIEHGAAPAVLDASVLDQAVRVAVADASPSSPEPRVASEFDERGRGLFLVAALASRWGTEPRPGGKAVWFEMDLPVASRAC